MEQRNLSDTFTSYNPQSMLVSPQKLRNKGVSIAVDKANHPDELVSNNKRGRNDKQNFRSLRYDQSQLLREPNSRNIATMKFKTDRGMHSIDVEAKSNSFDSERKSNYMVQNRLNNTYDKGHSKVHPVSIEIKKRILADQSQSTIVVDNNFSKENENEDICGICNQPFEIHSLDYNLDLIVMKNRYDDILDATSLGGKENDLFRPQSSISALSIRSMMRNVRQFATINQDRSRGKY
jgi:hypothetical protein